MTLLEALRAETRDAHEALHEHPLLKPLTEADLTVSQYGAALAAFDVFYTAMESGRTAATPAGMPDAPVRRWLQNDLENLRQAPLDLRIQVPLADTTARVTGYLYVKQGATLGGAVMSKNLNRVLGLRPGLDQMFFAGYGPQTGRMWKFFIENLYGLASYLPQNEIIEMAVASFQAIAAACDAVHKSKVAYAVQTPSGTQRKAAQGRA